MSAGITIEHAGPGTTIQDRGRFGWLRFGVTPAGPMDWTAHETANIALGNAVDAAAIEIGLGGIALSVDTATSVAFAGGGFFWQLGETSLPPACRVLVRPGERLVARSGAWGAFATCTLPGGILEPEIMGSRATHARSTLGGHQGRWLREGDRLESDARCMDDAIIDAPWLLPSDAPIRIVLGPQDDYFAPDAIATLTTSGYTLTATADRMAYAFDGQALAHERDFNIVSDGVALGAMQIAGDGKPLVLMADRQPTGGYAKIAHVCRADIGRLAQTRPGQTRRFETISPEAARVLLLDVQDRIAKTADHLSALRRIPTTDDLLTANLISGVTDGRSDD